MPSEPFRLRATALTHAGSVRPHNEDCIGINEWIRGEPMASPITIECRIDEPRLCVVADGMGGHAGGEIASQIAVRELAQTARAFGHAADIGEALAQANRRLYEVMASAPQLRGMGATIVGLTAIGTELCLFNLGDSRGYVRSGSYLRLLSIDDTPYFGSEEHGGRTGRHGHGITQSLGGLPVFQEVHPHLLPLPIRRGERYLLCSDGLTDMLDQDRIETCLDSDPAVAAQKLLDAALAEGGLDNISLIIIDLL
jgi:PPM family protein phosphatase